MHRISVCTYLGKITGLLIVMKETEMMFIKMQFNLAQHKFLFLMEMKSQK